MTTSTTRQSTNATNNKEGRMATTTTTSRKATKRSASTPAAAPVHPLASLIPDPATYLDGYVHRTIRGVNDFDYMDQVWEGDGNAAYNLLIEGPTGAAKTSLCYAWAASRGIPLLPISGTKAIDMEQLVGGPGIIGSELKSFVPGVLVQAMQYGALVLLDEKNYIPQKAMGRLNSLLDRRKSLEVKEAEGSGWCASCGLYNDVEAIAKAQEAVILHHLGKRKAAAKPPVCKHCGEVYQSTIVTALAGKFMVVATQNPGYEGVYDDNEAQRNRFHEVVTFDYDVEVEKDLLWSDGLMALAAAIRGRYGMDFETPLGTNRLMHFEAVALNEKLGIGFACEGLVDYFQPSERAAVKELLEMHLSQIEAELAEV
jgi:hypothetical protein